MEVSVIVNGQKVAVDPYRKLTFHDVADFAHIAGIPSMTFRMPGREGHIFHPGDEVSPVDGMIFNVADTSNA